MSMSSQFIFVVQDEVQEAGQESIKVRTGKQASVS